MQLLFKDKVKDPIETIIYLKCLKQYFTLFPDDTTHPEIAEYILYIPDLYGMTMLHVYLIVQKFTENVFGKYICFVNLIIFVLVYSPNINYPANTNKFIR